MPSRRAWLLLLLAVVLRLLTQGWDSGLLTPHPDERQVAFVSERVVGWLDDPGFYAYGSLHFRAVRAVTAVFGMEPDYQGLLVGGRALSLLASALAMLLGWWMATRAWGQRTGELFLLLMAFVPLDIQQSHYATVEAHHALWVVAALAACFWLATRSGWLAALAAGTAVGASLAVKVASLPLLLPLGLALIMASRRRDGPSLLENAGMAAVGSLAAVWLGQPWAMVEAMPPLLPLGLAAAVVVLARLRRAREGFLGFALGAAAVVVLAALVALVVLAVLPTGATDEAAGSTGLRLNPDYVRGVGEQIAMVAGRADMPYVRVYRDTLAFLYPAQELARWALGPMLFLVALGATLSGVWWSLRRIGRWLGRAASPGAILMVLVLAWLVPMSLRLATLHVKYVRYFEPLVVPLALVTAWWLLRLPSRWRRSAVVLTASGTVLWGVMYLWAFAAPHPHRTAGEWLAEMVRTDQVVAFEHWDETIGLPGVARIDLPSYDLPDDGDKVRRWGEILEQADWVVLTSNRVRRTVLVNRDRFPRTGRLYKLLLTGEAGFEPVSRAERRPCLFGLTRPVQLADESFLNYDFPRVVILRRVGEVDVSRLVERTARPLPFLEQLGPVELDRLAVDPLQQLPWSPGKIDQAIQLVLWLVVFVGLAAATWSILLPLVRSWPDAGLGLSLVTGWMLPAWILWLGSEIGVWPVGPASATVVFLVLITAGGVAGWRRRKLMVRLWATRRSGMVAVAVVAAAVGLLFLAVRASNPAIFWGEKPMDFSFLNAFLRADAWPPDEPWLAGMPLHYYYFGQVLSSVPILISGCHPAVGYNLMSATIPALGAALLAPLGLAFVRRGRFAAASLLPVLVLLTGNLAWPTLMELARSGRWFDMWWATSRVIPGFAIDEYPLWTSLFADLHGHFIALPVMLATLLWGWLVVQLPGRRWIGAAALCGLGAAVLAATNPWDVFMLTSALAVGTIVASERWFRGLLRLAVAGAASLLAGLPYIIELVAGIGAGAGGRGLFLTDADFAPAWAVVLHFAPFLVPMVVLAAAQLVTGRWWIAALPFAAAGIGVGLWMNSTAAALGLATGSIMLVVAFASERRPARFMWSMAALAMLAVAACERFTLIDRMNTIFKVYNGAWVLLAVALGGLLLVERGWRRGLLAAVWLPLQLAALVNLPLGIAQGWLQPRTTSPRPTLDGQAFLPTTDSETWFLAQGLMGMARPGEVVAEAADLAYSEFTRIAMHTGQPTVVGWPWHLQQRGQSRVEIDARYKDLEVLFGDADPVARREILDRYRVRWIVLADVERRTYDIFAEDPFSAVPGVVRVAWQEDGAALYLVRPEAGLAVRPVVTTDREIPAEVTLLASLPPVHAPSARSLAVDEGGATVVLPDGAVVDLDVLGRMGPSELTLGCTAASVARRDGTVWAICTDGTIWRRDRQAWRSLGLLRGATHLSVGDRLWAWGPGGMWRRQGGREWSRITDQSVTAAAALGGTVALSDGRDVWTLRGDDRRPVGAALEGVRALAWQGTSLWALADGGLHRSGGAVLSWRRPLATLGGVSAMAGSGERLWFVLDDGLVAQYVRPRCGSPWQGSDSTAELEQPRGLALSKEGWFAVADTGHDRLVWFTVGGTCLESVGEEGSVPGAFVEPTGLALAPDGSLAVTDTWNGRVQILRPDGMIQVVGSDLYGPRGVVWAEDGSLLVADTGNRVLLRFRAPDWRAEEILRFNGPVVGLALVDGLVAAAVPAEGEVVLVDVNGGVEVRRLPVPGWATRQQQEGYLAVLPSGELVASAPDTGELWRLDPAGVAQPTRLPTTLPGVTGLAVMPNGDLLVAQTYDHRLVRVSVND